MSYGFDNKTKSDYRNKTGSYHDDEVTIYEVKDAPFPKPTCPTDTKGSTLGLKEVAQFLYMDVGRWGGDGPGLQNTDTTWARQRDFGLVCGSAAILCAYNQPGVSAFGPVGLDKVDKKVLENPDVRNMLQILDKLSESGQLGPVNVMKALVCPYKLYDEPNSLEILVFLGDIHAPVMDFSERTYLEHPQAKAWARPRGRIDINIPKVLEVVAAITAFIPAPGTTVGPLASALEYFLLTERVTSWDANEKIPGTEAMEWFELYHGRGGAKGADIFQNAGGDLAEFIRKLLEYRRESGSIPVRLIQLGDLYDFWIGLKRGFDTIDPEVMYNRSAAQHFVDFWRNETIHYNRAGGPIDMLLNSTQELNPVFVYGNHDNYRATSLWSPTKDPDHFSATGIWAEHGHQDDEFNRDSSADIGWALTQLAFFAPNVRAVEEPLKNAKAWAWGDLGERLTAIRRAARICREKDPRKVYVMGHTHEPILRLVHVAEICVPPSPYTQRPDLPWDQPKNP